MTTEQRKARDIERYRVLYAKMRARPGITRRQWRELHAAARVVSIWRLVELASAKHQTEQAS